MKAYSSQSEGRLKGRRIVITGAASGIGEATAKLFRMEGASLALFDIDARVNDVAGDLNAFAILGDVSNMGDVRRGIAAAADHLRGIDGLVNSAGIVRRTPIGTIDYEAWREIMRINLDGVFLMCREAAPWLLKGEASTIVNLSSNQGLKPFAELSAYATSKAGVITLTKALAAEMAPRVRVNVVCPGSIATPMNEANRKDVEAYVARDPMKRIGAAIEAAHAVLFLTGPESTFVTGSTLAVDGGRTLY